MKLMVGVMVLGVVLVGVESAGAGPEVKGAVTVTRLDTPGRVLLFDVDVPAAAAEVWTALTTAEGMKTWITPDAKVDLRVGGDWLALFPGAAPGGGKVIAFEPGRKLTLRAMAPERFPTVRKVGTNATFTLTETGPGNTHVNLRQDDWQKGEEWDSAFEYLAGGNAMLLNSLRERFVKGPVDWERLARERQARPAASPVPAGPDIPANLERYAMVFLVEGPRRDQPEAEAAEIQKQHLAYIRQQGEAGVYALAGPFLDEGRIRGFIIVKTASVDEARAVVSRDPAVRSGRLEVEVHPALMPSLAAAARY